MAHQRYLPPRPDLDQLKRQAKELLRAFRNGDAAAAEEFATFHPEEVSLGEAKLADAQLVVARAHGVATWPRFAQAVRMVSALRLGDADAVRDLVTEHPELLHESADGRPRSNWGPPLSYAANLGHDQIIQMLADIGAKDLQKAFDRACLQGRIDSAQWLLKHGARVERGLVMGPCETLCPEGLGFLLEQGAELCDESGDPLAPVAMLLQGYFRSPTGKHACFDLVERHGVDLPDSPVMVFHRGQIDRLEKHLRDDPALLERRFAYGEVYPVALGCSEEEYGLHGTPLDGATLLHMAVDFDEMEVARWLVEQGADVNAKAVIDAEGFGGHTPLHSAAVSQAHVCGRQRDASMARLLIRHGADPTLRATIRKRIRFVEDESLHEFHDVTPVEYARAFHEPRWVCEAVLAEIERGL